MADTVSCEPWENNAGTSLGTWGNPISGDRLVWGLFVDRYLGCQNLWDVFGKRASARVL